MNRGNRPCFLSLAFVKQAIDVAYRRAAAALLDLFMKPQPESLLAILTTAAVFLCEISICHDVCLR